MPSKYTPLFDALEKGDEDRFRELTKGANLHNRWYVGCGMYLKKGRSVRMLEGGSLPLATGAMGKVVDVLKVPASDVNSVDTEYPVIRVYKGEEGYVDVVAECVTGGCFARAVE